MSFERKVIEMCIPTAGVRVRMNRFTSISKAAMRVFDMTVYLVH